MKEIPYWDLKVYDLAFQSAMHVYDISKQWPESERDALTGPVRHSSRRICIMLAQAWQQKRLAPDQFVDRLGEAISFVTETMVWLDFASQSGALDAGDHEQLLENYDDIGMILSRMMLEPKNWK